MRDLYAIDRENEQMRSAVTIKEALVGAKEIEGDPDQLLPEKPKSSAQWLKEYKKNEEQKGKE